MTLSKATYIPEEFINNNIPEIEECNVVTCPSCGSQQADPFSYGFDYELRTCRNVWHFKKCRKCELVRLDPRPCITALSTIYPSHYYSYDMEKSVNPFALKGKKVLDSIKFKSILNALNGELNSYLDIGCGDGRYLKLLESNGLARENLYGLELGNDAVNALYSQGYKVFNQRVEECNSIKLESLDLVTMFHVIEHVENPREIIERISNWLKPDGVLALETPNIDSVDAIKFKRTYWGGYHFPRHWYLFSEATLSSLLVNCGFEIISVKYQTGHSFWMYSLHHLLRYNSKRKYKMLSSWFDPLKGLPFLMFFTAIDIIRNILGFKTSSILIIAKKGRSN